MFMTGKVRVSGMCLGVWGGSGIVREDLVWCVEIFNREEWLKFRKRVKINKRIIQECKAYRVMFNMGNENIRLQI